MSPSPSAVSSTLSETPVPIARHYLRMGATGFECVQCGLVAPDFQTLHEIPCHVSVTLELHYETQKLFRLQQLRSMEQDLKKKIAQVQQDSAPAPPQPPAQCRSLRASNQSATY